jgi:hypothetical protein
VVNPSPRPQPPHDADLAAVIGPARLAYFTPVHDQPSLADRKAMFILGASGLIVTVLLFFAHPLEELIRSVSRPTALALAILLLCLFVMVLVAASTAYAGYRRGLQPMPPTLAWFRNVAAAPLEGYADTMRSKDHPAALRDMLHYNYSVASLAAEKFRLVNRALSCLRIALPLWMLLLLILAVWG